MDLDFKQGFEKTAIVGVGLVTKGLSLFGRKAFSTMPKVLKAATHSKGKFSLGRTVTGGAIGMEAVDVARNTKGQVNRRYVV